MEGQSFSMTLPTNSYAAGEVTVISSLVDLIIDGDSVRQNESFIFSSTESYLNAILGKDGTDNGDFGRRRLRIRLEERSLSIETVKNNTLPANPTVLKCLCGGLEASELIQSQELCEHSMNFLLALIHEEIMLKWTVHEGRNETVLLKVVLHSLPPSR
mmetsp:Transcript_8644/g.15112  ORF Transcript_8644/g.15112 Transcript_8644/m.15112 type:complete len:158 (-) Transcript_8644:61-534(-)